MALPIVITNAGLQELVNASATGTQAVTIASIGVSATAITPLATMTALPGQLYSVTSLSGSQVTPDTIHVVMQDSSENAYSCLSLGLFLADGTLFAIYGQSTPIYTKTASSVGMLAIDITFESALASAITVGNTNFINPPASQTAMGVVMLATLALAQAGTDNTTVLTPFTAAQSVIDWIGFEPLAASAFTQAAILALLGYTPLPAAQFNAAQVLAMLLTVDTNTAGLNATTLQGLTPAQLIAEFFSSGSNANGNWRKTPDGNGGTIIEQWGQIAIPPGSNSPTGTITFPIPFTALASIDINGNATAGANSSWHVASVVCAATSLNGGTWNADSSNSTQGFASGDILQWRAIGR
jgi:hypothetical protein